MKLLHYVSKSSTTDQRKQTNQMHTCYIAYFLFGFLALSTYALDKKQAYVVETPKGTKSLRANEAFDIASSSKVTHVNYLLSKAIYDASDVFPVYLQSTGGSLSSNVYTGNLVVDNTKGNYGLFAENSAKWTNGVPHIYTNGFAGLIDLIPDRVSERPKKQKEKVAWRTSLCFILGSFCWHPKSGRGICFSFRWNIPMAWNS